MQTYLAVLALLAAACSMAASAQEMTVPLPPGETYIGDIGIYRVAYQSYDGDVVEMPVSWTGHFETVSGISYVPHERLLGRDAILLHSPWHVPPGKVWVDYQLALPDARPITLSFGIAMRPDVAVPDRSDGVTFSCYLIDGADEQELMRQHQDKGEWLDYTFDLSPYAGKQITLRLQTEPGPNNSPSFDFSYFGDPKITAGTGAQGRRELLRRLTSSKAYRATAGEDLRRLSNSPDNGVVPSNLLAFENSIEKTDEGVRFTYEGRDARIVYVYEPATGTLDDFTVSVDGGAPFQPMLGGGVTTLVTEGAEERSTLARGGEAANVELTDHGKSLTVAWKYQVEGRSFVVDWSFGIVGKALTVAASCEQPILTGLSLGHVGFAPLRKTFGVPYLLGSLDYLPAENVYVCRYLDWTQSHSSRCPQGEASYDPKTDGTRNALHEVGYVAVSPDVGEVLPNLPSPPSPYLDLIGPRILLDIWGHHKGTYQGDGENLRNLKDNGVDYLAIISHVWQRYGYDVKLPDHLPANPAFGGDEGMIEFGKAANESGYVWSLHENYIDLYPDAPSYDPSARVLLADGSPSPAWFNRGTGVQSFGLKCNRALGYAKQNSPEIHRRFGTNAAYLDVHTCVPPWHQLDHEAGQPMAATELAKVKYDGELFQFMRDTHEGPLFGEGNNQFYWAGKVDGVEAQVSGGEHHIPFLDFDLLKVHPQMVNHGMGYYERWFERGYSHQLGVDTGTPEQVDKYRAQELAYGHAGFIGSSQTDNVQWVAKEHHLMHPVQALYGTGKPTEISYEVDGQFVSASAALALGERLRQRIKFDSGLTLWVNWAEAPWEVEGRRLPQWGFLALGPDTEVCTVLREGRFADYAECPEYLFADARTYFNMPYLTATKDIEPKLDKFEYLGGDRIRLTYEWIVNDTLDDDYTCFVHFINEQSDGPDEIVFQQDHGLPEPTSEWRKGETIVDGPYEITVPGDRFDTYDIVIGLFKGPRVPLKGIQTAGGRILIGRLELERDGGRITGIKLADISEAGKEQQTLQADFTAHMNPPGTWVDFGTIATDGSVKVNRGEENLVVFPYPRDRAFDVALNLKAIVPGSEIDPERVEVRALAAFTQEDMGKVASRMEEGRLRFGVGMAGAGRYVVSW